MSAISNLGRLREISMVIARHGLGHLLDKRRTQGTASDIAASARRFRAVLEELGPTFIKFGQVLSTRPDLLPAEFVDALKGLQDDCPPLSAPEVHAVIQTGLGRELTALFVSFDEAPIASASIAQVHRAVLPDGQVVAVKVQRPHLQSQMESDLDLLRYLALLIEAIVEDSGLVTPRGIVAEFESALLGELDFEREARMMRRFYENAQGRAGYRVPKVHDELCCRTVLTMEFVEGAGILELTPAHDHKKVAANVLQSAFDQLFVDGLFHADPHPGNGFVQADNTFVLLDFGSVGQISHHMRETLVVLVLAVGTRDADTAARLLYRVGVPTSRVSLRRLRDAISGLFAGYLQDASTLGSIESSALLKELFALAARFQIRIPSEYALVARAAVTIEGIIRQLDPELDVLRMVEPYVRRLLNERVAMPDLAEESMRKLLQAHGLLRDLPMMASQILMDLEDSKLEIRVTNPSLGAIARNIDALGVTIFLGLVAGGLVTGSFFLLARYNPEWGGVPVLPVAGLYLAAILLGGALGRYFLAPKLKKVSLGRLLGRRR